MAHKQTVTVKGLDPCFDKVVIQIVQFGDKGESHAADVTDGSASATFEVPFVSIKRGTVRVWPTRRKTTPECVEKQLNIPYVKELAELGRPVEVTFAESDRKKVTVPGGPELPGQNGRTPEVPEKVANPPPEGKVSDPGGLSLTPRPDREIAGQKDVEEAKTSGTVEAKGGAAAPFVYKWTELERGVYYAHFKAPPGVKQRRGASLAFLVEPDYDCRNATFYQWVRQTATFTNAFGEKFVGHVDKTGKSAVDSDAPQEDKQLPYAVQVTGTSPYAEDSPGVDSAETPDKVALFFIGLFPATDVPDPLDKLVVKYEFWTYVICVDPYYVVGHYEWSYDMTVELNTTPKKISPDPLATPTPTWVAGK